MKREPNSERRAFCRLPIVVAVFARGQQRDGRQHTVFANAVNISAGGMLLASQAAFEVDSSVTLELATAPLPPEQTLPLFHRRFSGRILRAERLPECTLYAIRFTTPIKAVAAPSDDGLPEGDQP